MARGVNKAILIGNVGADPETRNMPSGGAVTNLRIATSESWKDKQSGEKKESTEWHSVVMFGRLGDIAAQFLRKGRQVYVEGRIQTRKWQDKEGADRYSTEIVANEMQMLSGGERDSGKPAGRSGSGGAQPAAAAAAPADFSDDIPF